MTETCRPSEVCEVRILVATCVEAELMCTADTELEQRCNPEDIVWIQECRNVGSTGEPAYDWLDTEDCSAMSPDYICQQVDGNAPFCLPAP